MFLVNVHKFPMVNHVENIKKSSMAENWQFLEIHGGKTHLDIFTWAFRRLPEKLACRGDPF